MNNKDAIKLCKLDYELFPEDNNHLPLAISALEKQVKMVECGECKYYHSNNGRDYMCDVQKFNASDMRNPDDYCSRGERR